MEDRSLKPNGYKIRSWGDLIAIGTLVAMLLSVVAWGLKLEGELNTVRDNALNRIVNLESRVADGVLPRAEERLNVHRREIDRLYRELDEFEEDCSCLD